MLRSRAAGCRPNRQAGSPPYISSLAKKRPTAFNRFKPMPRMNRLMVLTLLAGAAQLLSPTSALPAETKPLRALLIAGGCCHDYARQKDILKKGLEARVNVQVEIIYSPDTSTKARFELYE